MSQDHLIKLACSSCKRINYWSTRNKKRVENKIVLKKHCKWCKKHVEHKELKK
ncbi:MAG: 50S ribosomal protein L33 [Candidatus Paceibacterota bacterium]